MRIYTTILLSFLYMVSLHGFSLKQLNPFAAEEVEETFSKEVPCEECSDIHIEGEGSVIIQTWKHPRIMVHATKRGSHEAIKSTEIVVKKNGINCAVRAACTPSNIPEIHYTIMVPEQCKIKADMQGTIKILNSVSPVELTSYKGSIKVIHAQATVLARAPKGKISVKQRSFHKESSLFLDAYGDIKLSLSRNHNADIQAKALNGTIDIRLFVMLEPVTMQITRETWSRLMKDIKVTLGDGGNQITLESTKGSIYIKEF